MKPGALGRHSSVGGATRGCIDAGLVVVAAELTVRSRAVVDAVAVVQCDADAVAMRVDADSEWWSCRPVVSFS